MVTVRWGGSPCVFNATRARPPGRAQGPARGPDSLDDRGRGRPPHINCKTGLTSWGTDLGGSALDVALRAIALRLERSSARVMAGAARSLIRFGRYVQTRLEIQRGLGVL